MNLDAAEVEPGTLIGRYALYRQIGSGGMATVHLGRLVGPAGFSRTVAIKRLHRQFAKDPGFIAMFLDEAQLAAKVRHPNVVSILDVVSAKGELFLVMDYVEGDSLAHLLRRTRKRGEKIPLPIAVAVVTSMLHGLHAAHEAKSDSGEPLGIVHRDVSPQNVLVGADGIARVADFGVAKAAQRLQQTEVGQIKGKLAYMAPEQLRSGPVDRRADVFAAGAVLWETLAGRRLFQADHPLEVARLIKSPETTPPSAVNPAVGPELDAIVLRALERDVEARYASCRDMVIALEDATRPAAQRVIGEWVQELAGDVLAERAGVLREGEDQERSRIQDPAAIAGALDPGANQSATSLLEDAPASAETLGTANLAQTGTLTTPLAEVTRHAPLAAAPPAALTESQITVAASWDMSAWKERPRRAALLGAAVGVVVAAGAIAALLATRSAGEPPPALGRSLTWAERLPTPKPVSAEPKPIEVVELPSANPAQSAGKPASSHVPARTAVKAPPSCDPPYVTGPDGIMRFKRECLK